MKDSSIDLLSVILISLIASLAHATEPVNIGSRLELFVDKRLVDEEKNVQFKLREPVRAPMAQSPLPERSMMTVIMDGDLFRPCWKTSRRFWIRARAWRRRRNTKPLPATRARATSGA